MVDLEIEMSITVILRDEAVYAQGRIVLRNLLGLDLGQCSDRVKAGVFG